MEPMSFLYKSNHCVVEFESMYIYVKSCLNFLFWLVVWVFLVWKEHLFFFKEVIWYFLSTKEGIHSLQEIGIEVLYIDSVVKDLVIFAQKVLPYREWIIKLLQEYSEDFLKSSLEILLGERYPRLWVERAPLHVLGFWDCECIV